jgi:UDP-N-acetylmuramate dehydrogenase
MRRVRNASLRALNSFGVEARAGELITLETARDLDVLAGEIGFDAARDLILGGGSNILFAGDIDGRVILNRVPGHHLIDSAEDRVIVDANGGQNWHQLVLWSLDQGLSGLENLSLIPGLVGAAPIQNIGAYGVELADVLDSVEVLDFSSGRRLRILNSDCGFGYRDSRFKAADRGRYLVTGIRLILNRRFRANLAYAGISEELQANGIRSPTARDISDAVIRIRRRKLPDPEVAGNAGSFFKNPLLERSAANRLKARHSDLPIYPVDEANAKVSAAWLIESCGWKGRSMGGAAVSDRHALVLINRDNATGKEILALSQAIQASVYERFGIHLQPEPHIITQTGNS